MICMQCLKVLLHAVHGSGPPGMTLGSSGRAGCAQRLAGGLPSCQDLHSLALKPAALQLTHQENVLVKNTEIVVGDVIVLETGDKVSVVCIGGH